ncbi:Cof-type HAD-IIB family hydrolase [Loigolactobacillus bifermentans]|uniref:Haloacid dehalogenase family hydrolase n=1 Tax=Loigolactobacillus bifermentans DSM 20003 TaxID=1423726 RepID=A0A0R1GY71_9LACO|nr:Cof-type HAD-IIB family hydrolase [Loigolactobacillus bifermentans]KRK39055.1 haloacid dehalogenase family hydrolase [Loigolactobacillus bifermentans DSM 20003]QGG59057.1 Cof-type HAD-IIB family hydrolase [Loigolactobacillus bifermentans]
MTYRALVFFDLDGTLMNAQSRLDPEVQQAVRQLKQNNVLPIICTGRSPHEIQEILAQTQIKSYITLNGAFIVYEGTTIYHGDIDPDLIGKLKAITAGHGDALAYYNDQTYRASTFNDLVKAQYDTFNTPYPKVDPDYYLTHPVYMLLVITVNNDKRYIYPYGDQLTFYRNSPYAMDTIRHGESKQAGIKTLIAKMGLDGIPTYAFGDGTNDLPMLEYVDHAIAMGNGITAAKDRAEYITSKNTENGIIQGLQHFNLLP